MLEIKFGMRAFLNESKVCIRVYWNKKQYETTFVTGVYAESKKWDKDQQRARKNSLHIVTLKCAQHTATSQEINSRIAQFKEEIENAFYIYSLKGSMPNVEDIRTMVNASLGRTDDDPAAKLKLKSLADLLNDFLDKGKREKNWDNQACEKYEQAFNHFMSANPKLTVDNISEDCMFKTRKWYVDNDYRNRTINKLFIMLKAFLKYINSLPDYSIPASCLNFETNFKVVKRTVTFMHFDELMSFFNFEFINCEERLSRVRDLWCFMAFTSLRYSDLVRLKPHHIVDGKRIEMFAEKTDGRLMIPLTDGALKIIERRGGKFGAEGLLFDVPTNQQMNDSIKDAAAVAGINREIVDTYFIGTNRYEEAHKFCEIISCHDARRTFVSCSLAMGIPPEVVMKCTGHTGYATMKPYIDTATETQSVQMEKWNKSQFRSQIITLLDKAKDKQLEKILEQVKKIVILDNEDEPKDSDASKRSKKGKPKTESKKGSRARKDTYSQDDSFSVMNAMKSGQLFHIEYDSSDSDSDEDDTDDDLFDYDTVESN